MNGIIKYLWMVALNLIMIAIPTQATEIVISAVPYSITAPGTYFLGSNLTYTGTNYAITINVAAEGNVELDLKEFTINCNVYGSLGIGITNPTGSSITVENGTIQGFWYDLWAMDSNNVHVKHINFTSGQQPTDTQLYFYFVSYSSVSDCIFAGTAGDCIIDSFTTSGNSYTNDVFEGSHSTYLIVEAPMAPLVQKHCQFKSDNEEVKLIDKGGP